MFNKRRAEIEVDRFWDACTDTGVGVPEDVEDVGAYSKDNNMELEYMWFGLWLLDNVGLSRIEKEIKEYNKKVLNGYNSREASYQVYSKYYREYEARNKF